MSIIPNKIVETFHKLLIDNEQAQTTLQESTGITLDTINKYKIGYDDGSYVIPIMDSIDACMEMVQYSIADGIKTDEIKNKLFPEKNFRNKDRLPLILCDNIIEVLQFNQRGINAVSNTNDISKWNSEWTSIFLGHNVVIFYFKSDIEKWKHIIDIVIRYANSLKVIGIDQTPYDYFNEHLKEDIYTLIRETQEYDNHIMIHLSDSMNPCWYDKDIKFHGVVIGKDLNPYLIPRRVFAECLSDHKSDKCVLCPLSTDGAIEKEYDNRKDMETIIKFVNCSDTQVKGHIRRDMHIPGSDKCRSVRIEVLERMSIEDISIIPEVNEERIDEAEYVTRRAFVRSQNLKTNSPYLFCGTTCSDPANQMGMHYITDYKSTKDTIRKFVFDAETKEKLKIFQAKDDDVFGKLKDIYTDMQHNVTHIYGRKQLIMAIDLVHNSVLSYRFLGRYVTKGWLECAIIGDTRVGKTETVKNMARHYRVGEFLTSGENTTTAGLLGGAQQHGNRWTLTWGKIPLNNEGIVEIDEMENLVKRGIIGELSGVRSSGIAELVKIQSQKTMARTRIIWIANPLKGRVEEYNYGVDIVKELFGEQQDISRLSFAIICGKDDVPKSIINSEIESTVPHVYTSELCHLRTMWIWNRRAEHIVWEEGSEKLILEETIKLSDRYSESIPLFLGAEGRVKLASISISVAASVFSTDDEMEKVIVKPVHVKTASKFLRTIYDNKNMGFYDYTNMRAHNLDVHDRDDLNKLFTSDYRINSFLELSKIQMNDLEDIFNLERHEAKEHIAVLRRAKCVRKHNFYYKKTASFIKYLKERKSQLSKENTDSVPF